MAGWLDRWARRAADPTSDRPEPIAPEPPRTPSAPSSSRRDFLKKAGIVGGAVWAVPVLQTVTAPAHAASNTPLGQPCNDLSSCANGTAYCNGSICGGVGAVCPSGLNSSCVAASPCSQRTGGTLTCGGPGATCGSDAACTFGNCGALFGNRCGQSAGSEWWWFLVAAPCDNNDQCETGSTCVSGRCRT